MLLKVYLLTPRIIDSGEAIFNYEYIRGFESKIPKALKVV
jgi:predicted Ser/Thr protein kinase